MLLRQNREKGMMAQIRSKKILPQPFPNSPSGKLEQQSEYLFLEKLE